MKLDPSMINVTRAGVKPAEATLTDGGLLLEWPDGTTVLIPQSALLIEEGEILLKDSSGNVEVTEPGKTTVTTDWKTACLEVRGDGIEGSMTVIGQIDQAFLFQAHWEDSPLPFAPLPRFEPPTYEELEIPESRLRQNNKPTIGNLTLRVSDEGLPFGKPDNFGFDDFTNSVIASGYIQVDDLNGDPLTFSLNPLTNAGLTSGGVAIVWSNSGSQKVIGTANGNVIFTVTVDNRGFVQVVQSGPLDHPDPTREDELPFQVQVVVSDGPTSATGTLTVVVEDDSPMIKMGGYEKVDEDWIRCEKPHHDKGDNDEDGPISDLRMGGGGPPQWGDDEGCGDEAHVCHPGNRDRDSRWHVEDGDDCGGNMAKGNLGFWFGADGPAPEVPEYEGGPTDLVVSMNALALARDPKGAPVPVTSGGQTVYTIWDPATDTLTGYIGDVVTDPGDIPSRNLIFTLEFGPEGGRGGPTGEYKFTLHGPLDHPSQNDGNYKNGKEYAWEDNLILQFEATITDGDGDQATQPFYIDVDDDKPTLKWDMVKVDEDWIKCDRDDDCDHDKKSERCDDPQDNMVTALRSGGGQGQGGHHHHGDDKSCYPGNQDKGYAPGDDRGCAVARGDMNFRFGADGPAADRPGWGSRDVDLVVKMHRKAERDDPDPQGHHHDEVRVTSGGKEVKTSWDHEADVLTGYIEERDHKGHIEQKVIFTLDLDPDGDDELTGNFKFTLLGPLDHPSQEAGRGNPGSNRGGGSNGGHDEPDGGYEDNLILKFDVTITDGDGDSVTQTLKVNVDDDMPTMKWDYVKVDEDYISCGKDQGCDDRDEPRPGDERSHQDNCERDDFEVAALSQGGNRRPGENEEGGRPPHHGDDKDCDPGNQDRAPGDDKGCAVARGDMKFRFGADGPAADRPGGGSRDVDLVVKMHHKAERDDPDPQGHHHDEVRVTSGGKEVKTSWDHEADVLTGYIEERDHRGRVEQKVIFTLDFDPDGDDELTGNFKFTLLGPLDHPSQEAGRGNPGSNRGGGGHDEPDGGYEDNLILKFDVTITDGDGDSVTQTLKVNVDDDMPTVAISRNDQAKFVLDESVGTDGSIKDEGGRSNDDETLQGEDGVIGFSHVRGSSLFTEQVDAGADGLESKVYKLTLAPGNPDSGLVDAVSDEKVILFIYNNGDVVGRTENSGELVFRVHVNEGNGSVTVKQFRAVEHDDPNDHDENQQSAAHLNAELIGLQVTVTDGDGDSASDQIEIGRYIRFEDDGPAVEIVRKASAKFVLDESVGTDGSIKDEGGRSNDDETLQGEDGVIGFSHVRGSSLFTEQVDAGADGLESKVYKLILAPGNPDSGLMDAASDEKVILFIYNNGDVVGRTENSGELVFRVHVNEGNGSVTVKQFRAVEHDDPNDHDENQQSAAHLHAELIGLQVTVTDGDGDSASDQIEIGRYIRFEDDGPSEIFPDSVSVLNQGGQCVFGNLDGVISMGGDGVVLDNVGSDKDGVVRFANIGDGDVSDFTTGGEAVYYFVSDDMQRLIATTSSSEEDVVTDESSQNFNVVFTIELQPDGRLDEYKVTTFAEIDSGGGSETISYELGSGNSDFFIEGESLPGGSGTEILITGNGSVNLASDIGINDQWIDPVLSRGQTTLPADYARIDFGLFSEDSNNDFVIDQHISINEVSFKVAQTGANALNQVDVEVRAFAANDNNDFTDDSQVEISQVKVFSASGMLIEDVDAGSVSNYVTFDADGDGSVIVKNALQGYRIVIFTVGGLNRIEVENSTVNAQANDQFTIDSISYVSEDVAQDVLDSFDIVLVDSDGDTTETSQFSVSFTSAISPVTLDLDGDGLEFIPLSEQLMFDFDGDGNLDQSSWVGPDDALLAIDLNGDGLVNDGSEVVFTQHAEGAETDLEGLALAYDSNHDGVLDANDDEFSLFGVWQDKNSNGITEEGEFMSLEEAGIVSIDLSGDGNAYTAAEGDVYIYGESSFTKADGETGAVGDAAFAVEYGSGEEMPDLSELLSDSDDAMDALLDSFGSDAPGEDGGSESSGSFSELDTSGDSPTSTAFEGLDEAVVAVDPLPAPEVIMDAPVAV